MRRIMLFFLLITVMLVGVILFRRNNITKVVQQTKPVEQVITNNPLSSLQIQSLQKKSYPGSRIVIEQTLIDASNYHQYIASYVSEGNKIYALLTVPVGKKPKAGWPVILLNHGYIPPDQYNTITSYSGPTAALASAGYIVFKPDYRGNGNSEGTPSQVYISDGYVTDSINALSSIAKYPEANSQKIGVWGHSMGGNITLHELVITKNIKAAVLWAGVVGNYSQTLQWWDTRIANKSITGNDLQTAHILQQIISVVGTPSSNPNLWNSIDPTAYLSDVTAPVQIDVGTADTTVPPEFSLDLARKLQEKGKAVELFTYPGADHNLSPESSLAMQRSITFFNKYLK